MIVHERTDPSVASFKNSVNVILERKSEIDGRLVIEVRPDGTHRQIDENGQNNYPGTVANPS